MITVMQRQEQTKTIRRCKYGEQMKIQCKKNWCQKRELNNLAEKFFMIKEKSLNEALNLQTKNIL